ncbi:MAG: hypothetical protein J6A16_11395, partial [Oscillospiraceae bacterium]|nr:hypothetical protein [Oscillospiraceae bacterium]
QNNIIKSVGDNKGKDGGIMGRFLGNKPSNVSMHIALILCLSLIILIVIDMVHSYFVNENLNMDLINLIVPVVTLSLGYIFGKGNSD